MAIINIKHIVSHTQLSFSVRTHMHACARAHTHTKGGTNHVKNWDLLKERVCNCMFHRIENYIQGVSGGIVNILGGRSMDYVE
jgi:hypothetical protein